MEIDLIESVTWLDSMASAFVRQRLLTEGWVTVDADDFAMQDGTAVTAVTFPADDRPTTLGTAYLDYLALALHVSLFKGSGATDDIGAVTLRRSLFESNHPH
jgi:hypothetical protein